MTAWMGSSKPLRPLSTEESWHEMDVSHPFPFLYVMSYILYQAGRHAAELHLVVSTHIIESIDAEIEMFKINSNVF